MQFAKLFGDEFTLDHISRGQLTGMCKFVGLSAYGTDSYYVDNSEISFASSRATIR